MSADDIGWALSPQTDCRPCEYAADGGVPRRKYCSQELAVVMAVRCSGLTTITSKAQGRLHLSPSG